MTLDTKHKSLLEKFDKDDTTLPSKRAKLEKLEKRLSKNDFDIFAINDHYKLIQEVDALKSEISRIEKQRQEYFEKIGDKLIEYYNDDEPVKVKKVLNPMELLMSKSSSESSSASRKGTISKEYFQIIDPKNNYVKKVSNDIACKFCGKDRTIIDTKGLIVCRNEDCDMCGFTEETIVEAKKSSYKDPPPEVCSSAYQRKGHFMDVLVKFQAKESVNIPPDLYIRVNNEILKERITNLAKIDYRKIKKYLKKLGFNKYYDHIPLIHYKITGIDPPKITHEQEKDLIRMFDMTQEPYEKIKNTINIPRVNFLNYKYALYKFLEVLDLHKQKNRIVLLDNRDRLIEQDILWKAICEEIQKRYPKSKWKDKWKYVGSV